MSITRSWPTVATVNQLRTAVKLEPRPEPDPKPEPKRSISQSQPMSSSRRGGSDCPTPRPRSSRRRRAVATATALITDWKTRAPTIDPATASERRRRSRATVDAFMSLVEAGWDADVARRPHGQHTTVVVHLDVEKRGRRPASGSAAVRGRPPLPDSVMRPARCGSNATAAPSGRPGHPHHQPPAAPRPGAPRPTAVWSPAAGPPAGCTPITSGIGRTAAHRAVQPGAAVPVPPPRCTTAAASPSPDPPTPDRHRQRRGPTDRTITGPPTHRTTTRCATVPRADRRTRRLVVVRPLRTPTTTHRLTEGVASVTTST